MDGRGGGVVSYEVGERELGLSYKFSKTLAYEGTWVYVKTGVFPLRRHS